MKVFYFGSVCSNEVFNKTVAKSRVKPSSSAQNFENALIKGFAENKIDVSIATAESIATFPNGNRIYLKQRTDILSDVYSAQIIPALNLPAIKQFCHAWGAKRILKRWLKKNADETEKCVLVYGMYPAVVKQLLRVCHIYNCKIFSLITDVPSTMFTYSKNQSLVKRVFASSYRSIALALQDQFDGYVYLTEEMKNEVAPGKPYVVIETLADTSIFEKLPIVQKHLPPALMYAGALHKKYGVDLILESFEKLHTDCELWLFGSGDFEQEIKSKALVNPKIKFFGRAPRETVLRKEKEATLLLNLRNPEDSYTKYSFPSKMAEYMLSGTPVLTTMLSGIPDEYYAYCYATSNKDPQIIANFIDEIISSEAKNSLGTQASSFVYNNKNSAAQTAKIIHFLESHIY